MELSTTLYKVFNNKHSVDLKRLCITPGEHCWVLYVDVLVGLRRFCLRRFGWDRRLLVVSAKLHMFLCSQLLQCDGNLYDAISIAVKAALFNTK